MKSLIKIVDPKLLHHQYQTSTFNLSLEGWTQKAQSLNPIPYTLAP